MQSRPAPRDSRVFFILNTVILRRGCRQYKLCVQPVSSLWFARAKLESEAVLLLVAMGSEASITQPSLGMSEDTCM